MRGVPGRVVYTRVCTPGGVPGRHIALYIHTREACSLYIHTQGGYTLVYTPPREAIPWYTPPRVCTGHATHLGYVLGMLHT